MYIEKEFLLQKINEYCSLKGINLSFDEKYKFSTIISRELDKDRCLDFETFIELLEHNEQLEQYDDLDFDDEIISIEEYGEIDMIDFNVSGNKLFYANDILTHNSATNNIDDADNSNVSDSMGSVMTADFLMFLLQNEEMKEKSEIVCKVTKNRFAGRTDTWMMNIDYEHMKFNDMILPDSADNTVIDIIGTSQTEKIDDFGIITAEKQQKAEDYATNTIKEIAKEDYDKVQQQDKKDPFNNGIEDLFKQLGV